MAYYRNENMNKGYARESVSGFSYEEYGNAVRVYDPLPAETAPEPYEAESFPAPERVREDTSDDAVISNGRAYHTAASHRIDMFYMLFLLCTIAVTLLVCIKYLQIRSDIVQLNRTVNALEERLSDTVSMNDALQADIEAQSFDAEYVYNTAVGVLGMVFPNNNEIFTYSDEMSSYYREYKAAD